MMLAVQPTLISLSRLALKPYPAHLRDQPRSKHGPLKSTREVSAPRRPRIVEPHFRSLLVLGCSLCRDWIERSPGLQDIN